jgi:hypothetical protein
MPKYHEFDNWDADTNAPSSNFAYDFERYRYLVCDNWEEVFSHTADGEAEFGSIEAMQEAFMQGREIKVGIRGLCADLAEHLEHGKGDRSNLCDDQRSASVPAAGPFRQIGPVPFSVPDHTVFVQTGPGYFFTQRRLFSAGSQPVVRVRPGIPIRYTSGGWDFGWLMPRSDGFVDCWLCDPYTLRFRKSPGRYAIRWFVR